VERAVASSTVARGHYALDPDPFGAPFVPNEDPHAPVSAMAGVTVFRGGAFLKSAGPRGTPVIHPQDAVGLHYHSDAVRLTGCCEPSGMYGRNLVCGCGRPVATLVADCLRNRSPHRHRRCRA
jgi:hypothetical protein